MKIVFMGTPEFARVTLTHLCDSDHELLAVVTGRDQKSGRGQKLLPTACRREAEKRGLQVFTPVSLNEDTLYESLRSLQADLFVVCAFRILPKRLFNLPRLGSINIHMSLLPKYRGAAPINWALINGESETGMTSFFLRESVDTGDMILQEKVAIDQDDSFDTLSARLADRSGPFLLRTIDLIESCQFELLKQNESETSRAPKLGPFDAMIDFGFPAEKVRNFIRGMSTKPGAYTFFRGKKLKVYACAVANESAEFGTRPGTVLEAKKRLLIQCDGSALELLQVVPQGKKAMNGSSFINGYRPEPGEIFGEVSQEADKKK
jgi:methionyl-tRNA formyltransferase